MKDTIGLLVQRIAFPILICFYVQMIMAQTASTGSYFQKFKKVLIRCLIPHNRVFIGIG